MKYFFAQPLMSFTGLFILGSCIFSLLLLMWVTYRRLIIYNRLANNSMRSSLLVGFSWCTFISKRFLWALAIIMIGVGLFQPQWGTSDEKHHQEVRELFIALDVSRSMLAQDVQPNRLELAKQKIERLIKRLQSERVGLILFAGNAIVQCPLTTDWSAFNLFLRNVDRHTIGGGTTALDQAIHKGIEAFNHSAAGKNKIMVLFTDGEDFSSDLASTKQQAMNEQLHIFTVGIGTQEGGPIPLFDEHDNLIGHQKDIDGSVVISRLNHGILQSLSQACGGQYIALSLNNDKDIETIALYIEGYEKEAVEARNIAQAQEKYYWFGAVAFFCLLLEWLL